MNQIKNKLYEYKIQPSARSWERIESELDAKKSRKIVPMRSTFNVRWAAAAMLLFAATGAITWSVQEKSGLIRSQVNVENKCTPIVIPIPQTPVPTNDLAIEKPTLNVDSQVVVTKDIRKNIEKISNKIPNNDVAKVIETEENNSANDVRIINIIAATKREKDAIVSLGNRPNTFFETTSNVPTLPTVEIDEYADAAFDFKGLILSEDSDSTLTERVIVLGSQKARQLVSRAWQPTLQKYLRLRKGF